VYEPIAGLRENNGYILGRTVFLDVYCTTDPLPPSAFLVRRTPSLELFFFLKTYWQYKRATSIF
jgi:hypothetical protein